MQPQRPVTSRLRGALRRGSVGVAVLATAVSLAACGGSDKGTTSTEAQTRLLDTGKVATAIEASIKQQRDITATATCPTGVAQREGATFECVARYRVAGKTARQSATFTVTQGKDGNVTYVAK